jgi:hypothetical protein
MGEWSKKVGEHGEDVVKNLLEIIGWKYPQRGIDIECSNGEEHKPPKNKGPRKEHGIDFIHFQKSPFFSSTLQFHCVSSKYKGKDAYPQDPIKKIKEYLIDISIAVECFTKSSLCKKTKRSQSGASNASFAGVLFWLHNSQEENAYDDLISRVSNIQLPPERSFNNPIYVVDNKQANFIFDCHNFMTTNFNNHEVSYFYHKTGTNEGSPSQFTSSGPSLPVELITSELFIYRADKEALHDNEVSICVLTLEEFSEDGLKKIMGMSHEITSALPSEIFIAFSNYNKLNHESIVNRVKMEFEDSKFTERFSVHSLYANIHNI